VGTVEEFPWEGSSPGSNDGVRRPEDDGGDGTEKLERGDGELSGALNGSLAGWQTASSTAALVRCRL